MSATPSSPTLPELERRCPALRLIARSIERGRLGHAYLIAGRDRAALEQTAAAIAQTLLCENPPRRAADGSPAAACGACEGCRLVREGAHPDAYWLRPEGKTRVIRIAGVRELERVVRLHPARGGWKVAVITDADRLHPAAANAFLKTLEEPPGRVVILLLSLRPEALLETIRSRCLRLDLGGETAGFSEAQRAWIEELARAASRRPTALGARYRALGRLLEALGRIRQEVEESVREASGTDPADLEPEQRERLQAELNAAAEAEYRRRRNQFLQILLWWLRDVWLAAQGLGKETLKLPDLAEATQRVATALPPDRARTNLEAAERTLELLETNVQEALALETGLLRLDFGE
ncbi:MAG: DNA polymerase III subunit [Verrucomicrobia bacterium]|nr:DNA polymerase III subunit [Verrucomicrobiota bacterium]